MKKVRILLERLNIMKTNTADYPLWICVLATVLFLMVGTNIYLIILDYYYKRFKTAFKNKAVTRSFQHHIQYPINYTLAHLR